MTEGGPRAPRRSRRAVLAAAVAAWALLLGWLGYRSAREDPPTAREQRTAEAAAPVVDGAAAEIARAAARLAATVAPAADRREPCEITPLRPGDEVSRTLVVTSPAADGPALLRALAAELPGAYGVTVYSRDGVARRFTADAGEFVAVRADAGPRALSVTIATGCRPRAGR
ncbi:hypothetical protein GCM10010124_22980 [Pilimelia terevasa]|uniref:Uncharacterized protein n=1 Tax=Pilimelia terevasa TaxID=53372 RepID=A0A8J3FKQ9_9ACTN|nr:hypothetical protein [Pilimelia terevasa]GGK29670.1 hypothetical protein GCM10010124_22980 [Pilimelia terevasa]